MIWGRRGELNKPYVIQANCSNNSCTCICVIKRFMEFVLGNPNEHGTKENETMLNPTQECFQNLRVPALLPLDLCLDVPEPAVSTFDSNLATMHATNRVESILFLLRQF